ncbi:TonB-dependent siderophore receptor [Vibrio diazotrophicus]|uniref:TonB-dependent siderophore receptor n=1 Tax=Vibrio diazotrophicus TaxID=685 RepID=UPI003D2F85B2
MVTTRPTRLGQAIRTALCFSLVPFSLLTSQSVLAEEVVQKDSLAVETIVVTASALKVDTPAQETPKSVSIIDRTDLEQHDVQKLDEALRYTPGFTSPYGADNDAEWMFVRGFEPSVYLDGNRLYKEGFFAWVVEPFGLERVELVKGPSSVLYGETMPGGVINVVQKKPTDAPQGKVTFSVGNKDYQQLGVDVSNWANEDGSQRYRLVAMVNQKDGEKDRTENQRVYIAPSYSIDFSEETSLTLLMTFLQDDGIPVNNFLPSEGVLTALPNGEKFSTSANYGLPDSDGFEKTQVSLGYQLSHQLNDVWALNQNFNYSYVDLYLRSTSVWNNYDGDAYTLGRYTNFNDGDSQSFTIDNNALAEWQSDSFEHRFLTGFDLQHHENSWLGNSAIGSSAGNVNILNPTYVTPDISADLYDNEITKQQLGLYAQYQTKWDQKWIFNLGGRYDSVNLESTATNKDEMDDGQLSLSGGLMYLSDNGFSPYVSYSESFYAVSSIDATTKKLFKPIESAQREVGVKYMPTWLDGYFNVAWFDIEQDNATVSALVDGVLTTSQKGSQQNTKGVEVEAKIAMTENLIVNANYTYLDSHSGEGSDRSRDSLIPRHLASGWVTYDFSGLGIEGLTVGSGVRYTGTSVDSPKNETIPAYLLWDAMATYAINKKWDMQFNVSNLTNEEYVAGCDWGTCYYGESRRMTATVNYNW